VFPIDDQVDKCSAAVMQTARPRDSYTYWGAGVSVPAGHGPRLTGSFSLAADIQTAPGTADGVLAALGGHFGGWSFYLKDGYPVVTMAGSTQAKRIFRVAAGERVPPGKAQIVFDFRADGPKPGTGGTMRISVNGRPVGEGRIEQPIVMTTELTDTFDVGFDASTPVTDEYQGDGQFTGQIDKVVVKQ